MPNPNDIEQLIEWASTIDHAALQNEDDVETKIILPFFKLLGYPESHRRGKFPIDDYQSRRAGRKSEADQVYFSTAEPEQQDADTTLLLIEAKKIQIHDLSSAIGQAKYYGNFLKPPFLVITNGLQIIALKRQAHRTEEMIVDITIDQLRDQDIAKSIYNQLRFETVKKLKEQLGDPLKHAQYVELIQMVDHYPDIREYLAKGDFEPSNVQNGRLLRIAKPKVAITCELPIAFAEGNCTIEFSNLMLQGLTCRLLHEEIITNFLIGLETSPEWETRPFIHTAKQNIFEAQLGETTVILSKQEANELCEAVDEVCKQYKEILIETTNVLETWDFRLKKIEDEQGFELFSVEPWLWEKMHQFSQEFDYDNGDSEWHIFQRQNLSIRVCPKGGPDHVVIYPHFGSGLFPSREVDLLYVDCITYLYSYEDATYDTVFQNVGTYGVWTAKYTKEWLEQQFLPKVLSYYSINYSLQKRTKKNLMEQIFLNILPLPNLRQKRQEVLMRNVIQDYSSEDNISWDDIHEPAQLVFYLHEVQSLFYHYRIYGISNVSASLLRQYYATFTDLARCANPDTVKLDYILGNLRGVMVRTERDEEHNDTQSPPITYEDALTFLTKQVTRIQTVDYENHYIADLLSRAFISIIEDGTLFFQQNQMNAAKTALFPLWEQSCFCRHFIDPIIDTE